VRDRRRLYLGRDGARWRKIINEADVRVVLSEFGFEFPAMTQLSVREQVELISGAEMVISAAGAGSVILYFAPSTCIHIVLAPKGVARGPWGGLGIAISTGQVYHRLECEVVADSGSFNAEGITGRRARELSDFVVDLAVLRNTLAAALAHIDKFYQYGSDLECAPLENSDALQSKD
jgi:hypothetical protein